MTLAEAQAYLTQTLMRPDVHGRTIKYTRDLTVIENVPCFLGASEVRIDDSGADERVTYVARSYFVVPTDLGALFPPQPGDKITLVLNNKLYVDVVGAEPGVDVWTWADDFGHSRIRIRAKQTKEIDV